MLTQKLRKEIQEITQSFPELRRMRKDLDKIGKSLQTSDFSGTYSLDFEVSAFWDKIRDIAWFLPRANVISIEGSKYVSRELTLGSNGEDVLRPGVELTDPGDTATIGDAERSFVPEEWLAEILISDRLVLQHDLHQTFTDRFLEMLFKAIANEVEYACWHGVKVGTTNSSRGSITGMFDGWLKQINDGGTVLYATDYSDRKVDLDGSANDKHLAMLQAVPAKYSGIMREWLTSYSLAAVMAAQLGPQRATPLGDRYLAEGYSQGVVYLGAPAFFIAKLRTDHLVKGTGTVEGTNPGDTTLASIAKARQAVLGLTSATNFGDTNKVVVGCDAAGTSFELHAENRVQSGAASGNNVTVSAALSRDHAAGENVTEYSTAPTANGIPTIFDDPANFTIAVSQQMSIEFQRQARKRGTDVVINGYMVPVIENPAQSVMMRDMAV